MIDPRERAGSDSSDAERERAAARRSGISLAVGCAGIGLLLWARLVIVADYPRMALAEPKSEPAVSAPSTDVEHQGGSDATNAPVLRDGERAPND